MNIEYYMTQARNQAKKSDLTDWRMGAVIVKNGKIIGRGHNRYSASIKTFEKRYGVRLWSLHAEQAAIQDCDHQVKNSVLFIAGIKRNGNKVLCKPCKHCLKIIRQLPFKAVYYETKNGIEALDLNE